VEADGGNASAGTQAKVTSFARRAAHVILVVGKGGDRAALAEAVGALRDELGITVPPEAVLETCLLAAGAALAALRSAR
jgi:hypothetical protein